MSAQSDWFTIGHVTHEADRTGCTVILFDELVPATVDVRGGAPGTRETDLLQSGRLVGKVDALLFAGGSAFGLAAAEGVVRYLVERGRGFPTNAGPVPIVPAAVIFDRTDATGRYPNADDGYAAAADASTAWQLLGRVGAGTGATVAKLGGRPGTESGVAAATVSLAGIMVTAILVVNAVGDIIDPSTATWLARSTDTDGHGRTGRQLAMHRAMPHSLGENTTIGAVMIDAAVDRDLLSRCCVAAHDALARCIVPAHTVYDGDTIFAVGRSHGEVIPEAMIAFTSAVEVAVEQAIVALFRRQVPD
jgi:L-aminopeptidase/D-esterase-like protein